MKTNKLWEAEQEKRKALKGMREAAGMLLAHAIVLIAGTCIVILTARLMGVDI